MTTKRTNTEKTNVKKTNNVSKINEKIENVDLLENEILDDTLNVSDDLLLNIDLDKINFESVLKDSKKMKSIIEKSENTKQLSKKFELYAFKTNKSDRQKIRTNLKKYCLNIFSVVATQDEKTIKEFITSFLEFYKTNYKLNNFTLDSLSYPNRDKDTEENINAFLELFKSLISK